MSIKKKIFIVVGLLLLVSLLFPLMSYSYWYIRVIFGDPMWMVKVDDQYRKLPTQEVVKKLYSIDPFSPYSFSAITVLTERKAPEAVPHLIKITKSIKPSLRSLAIRSLGEIGDKRAIPRLLEIIEKGEDKNERDYHNALYALSLLEYEPIRPLVLERLKRPDGLSNGATTMMKYIGKEEDLPLLQELYENVKGDDTNARIDRGGLRDAIDAIKARAGK